MNRLSAPVLPLSPFIWLAAFVCALYPLNQHQLLLMAAAVMLLWLWSFDRLRQAAQAGVLQSWQGILPALVAALWGLAALSVLWSAIPWVSLIGVFFLGALPLTFLTLVSAPFAAAEWRVIKTGVAAIFTVLAVWALVQFIVLPDYVHGRARHPLNDPNSLAALFNLILVGALGAMTMAQTGKGRLAALAFALLLSGGLMATGSRGAFFALAGGLFLIAVLCRHPVWRARRWWGAFLIGFVLIMASSSVVSERANKSMAGRVAMTVGLQEGVVAGDRHRTVQSAWELVKDHWLTGTGLNTFYAHYPAYRSPLQKDQLSHAHSDPLQFWAEMGIAAPLLFYGIGLAVLVLTGRRWRAMPPDDPRRPALAFPFVALAVLMAHSHINMNLYNLSILLMAGMMLAYWYGRLELPARTAARMPGKGARAAGGAVFMGAMALYFCLIASDFTLGKARGAMVAGDMERYAQYMMASDAFARGMNPHVYLTAVHIPLALLQERAGALDAAERRAEADQIANNLDRALALNGRLAAAYYFKGVLKSIEPEAVPDVESPKAAYEAALRLDPMHLGARNALIDMAIKAGDLDGALALVEGARHFRMNSTLAREYYARGIMVYAMKGDAVRKRLMERALERFERRVEQSVNQKPLPVQAPR